MHSEQTEPPDAQHIQTQRFGINYASCLAVVIKAHANGELKKVGSKLKLASKVGTGGLATVAFEPS